MVTSLNNQKAAHDFNYGAVNYFRITMNGATGAHNRLIGKLPIGAVILWCHSVCPVALAGATGLSVGTLGDVGLNNVIPAFAITAVISELLQPAVGLAGPTTQEVELWAALAGPATAGSATITIAYSTTANQTQL